MKQKKKIDASDESEIFSEMFVKLQAVIDDEYGS